MGVKVINPPAQVIDTATLRSHVRIADTSEDALLVIYLQAAVAFAQHYTQRSFGEQTLELALDAFPSGAIELPQGPVSAITTIKYIDTAGVEQTLSNTLYVLDNYGLQCWAVQKADTEWPDTQASANAVKVRYTAGDLPDAVRSALLLLVGHLFENRENSAPLSLQSLPVGAEALLNTVKIWGM